MTRKMTTEFRVYDGGRHILYLPKEFVHDSAFPFSPGDMLEFRIRGKKVIIEAIDEAPPRQAAKRSAKRASKRTAKRK